MKTRIAVAIASVVLAGCKTQPIESMNYTQQKALAEEIAGRCAAQGAGPGTANFRTCFDIEARAEHVNRALNRQRLQQAGEAMQRAGAEMEANRPRHTTCNTSPWGQVNCTTF